MPIYEYQCDACQHKFEVIRKASDKLLEVCPECGEKKLRKLVSAAAFHLKGTGWYVTDFKDKKPLQQTGKTEEKTAGPGEPAQSGSESKSSEGKESKTPATETKKSDTGSKSEVPKPKPTPTD